MSKTRRKRRWVDAEIAKLDPEVDYERIVKLIAEYKMNDFAMNLNYAIGFMSNTVPAGGSDVMYGTGKAEQRPQTRYLDTVKVFWMWFFEGPSSPKVQESIKRINGYHEALYKQWPASFELDEDYIFSTCNLLVAADRMRDLVGVRRQPRNVQIAWYNFWRDVMAQMTGMHGALQGYPDSYEAAMELVEEFEQRDRPYTSSGNKVAELMIGQFVERFFPKQRWLGRQVVLAFAPAPVLKRHLVERPNPVAAFIFRRGMQFMFFAQDHFAPDNKIPTSEALRSEAYTGWSKSIRKQESDKVRAERALARQQRTA